MDLTKNLITIPTILILTLFATSECQAFSLFNTERLEAPSVQANNTFAFDLFSKLNSEKSNEKSNIFFSPLSVSSAFEMVYEGALGDTASEISSVFHFPQKIEDSRKLSLQKKKEFNKTNKHYDLTLANALWVQKDYKILDSYTSTVKKFYNGETTNLDFVKSPEPARATINKWVENKTNNKIQNIITPGTLNGNTKLVLTNAIYFKGKWEKPFKKSETIEQFSFKINKKDTVYTAMMNKQAENFFYTETKDEQMLEIPYKGGKLSMLLILPKENNTESFTKKFTAKNFLTLKKELKDQKVIVKIPRFKFDTNYSMVDSLQNMGVKKAFSGEEADFSKINGKKDLSIGAVIHKAFIDVAEEGTEAAAATAITMNVTSVPLDFAAPAIPVFTADHPFIFVIQNKKTGEILFMGKVINPNKK